MSLKPKVTKEATLSEMTDELARSILRDILDAPANDPVCLSQKIDALKTLSGYNKSAGKSLSLAQGSAFDDYRKKA